MNNYIQKDKLISDLRTPRRGTAIARLVALGPDVFPDVLKSVEENVPQMKGAAAFFQAAGAYAAPFLLQARVHGGWPTENYASQVLSFLDGSYLPHFRPLASDSDPELRAFAVTLLGQHDPIGEADILIEAMKDSSPEVRASAAGVLHGVGTEEAMRLLMEALDGHRPWFERAAAACSLGAMREPAGVWPLIGCLDDEEKAVRDAAAMALGQVADKASVIPLIVALQRQTFPAAIFALGQIGDARAIRPLIAYLVDRHQDGNFRPAIEALVGIGPVAVKPLIDALDDENDDLRYGAVLALGRIGLEHQDVRVVAPLLSRWRDPDENPHLSARKALARLGVLAAPAVLEMAKGRGRRRKFAEEILAGMDITQSY